MQGHLTPCKMVEIISKENESLKKQKRERKKKEKKKKRDPVPRHQF